MDIYGKEEDRAKWAMHYAQVKANIEQPQRSHTVTVSGTTKQGKPYNYEYSYADLADVDKAVMEGIKKATDKDGNVVFSYFFDIVTGNTSVTVQTVLIDSSGFTVKTNKITFQNSKPQDAQATASLISYAKRYSLSGAFGIAADDDDDAQDQKTIYEPKVLTKKELEEYKVYYNGTMANLYDLYQEAKEGIKDAQDWFNESHTPQDAQAVHQIAQIFKKKHARTKESDNAKKAALDKIQQSKTKEPKKDPFADKKVASGGDTVVDGLF
ncbi:ERF family protein [Lactobacillus gasseri]|uniref:ERF family protein n=1 Tax=Lactobacillus gasseri TaxID=1596 RepID=UPI000E441075|nr:ERF family protein [Lactobacillus gasseri]MCZ3944390.1 ERF family protein [Lactobacillus gasseri]MCZ3947108.1 ERF family protein [Lactobacillus gasseri]MCZ3980968.1 ERF family protein [Lactobacillus gasseri]MCZ3995128.1 ERF family protein [Lactobacillus gasseri]MCZ4003346.1 ERF family protein [Lactobacillus gasseri]